MCLDTQHQFSFYSLNRICKITLQCYSTNGLRIVFKYANTKDEL